MACLDSCSSYSISMQQQSSSKAQQKHSPARLQGTRVYINTSHKIILQSFKSDFCEAKLPFDKQCCLVWPAGCHSAHQELAEHICYSTGSGNSPGHAGVATLTLGRPLLVLLRGIGLLKLLRRVALLRVALLRIALLRVTLLRHGLLRVALLRVTCTADGNID